MINESSRFSPLTTLHESHAPVNALCETLAQQRLSDVAFRVENGADQVSVVHRFEDYLNVALQESRFNEETSFAGERNVNSWIGFAVRVETEAGTANATDHERDVLEAGQEEGSNGGSVAYMFNDCTDRLAALKLNEMAGVFDLPHDGTLGWRLSAETSLALRLCLIFDLDESLQFGRAADTFTANLQEAFAYGQLRHVGEVVGIFAEEDDTVIAGCIGFAFSLEEDFFTDQQATQEFT